jgi:hypothetical protein
MFGVGVGIGVVFYEFDPDGLGFSLFSEQSRERETTPGKPLPPAARLEKILPFRRAIVIMFLNRRISNEEYRISKCWLQSNFSGSKFLVRYSTFWILLNIGRQPAADSAFGHPWQ